jgi:hypothetical protein
MDLERKRKHEYRKGGEILINTKDRDRLGIINTYQIPLWLYPREKGAVKFYPQTAHPPRDDIQ